jgi:hypothetical protein
MLKLMAAKRYAPLIRKMKASRPHNIIPKVYTREFVGRKVAKVTPRIAPIAVPTKRGQARVRGEIVD